uniref:Uncharacterized protein n=1 Tax=Lepeophtheirus salmonis TaxID=72036 RepID=A0A0K2U0G0_LEPSM
MLMFFTSSAKMGHPLTLPKVAALLKKKLKGFGKKNMSPPSILDLTLKCVFVQENANISEEISMLSLSKWHFVSPISSGQRVAISYKVFFLN